MLRLEPERELRQERDPALVHVVVDAIPRVAGRRLGPHQPHSRAAAGDLELEDVAAQVEPAAGLDLRRAADEVAVDLRGERRVVPAEPLRDERRVAQCLPDALDRRGNGDVDDDASRGWGRFRRGHRAFLLEGVGWAPTTT
jgi:hypothetical protein